MKLVVHNMFIQGRCRYRTSEMAGYSTYSQATDNAAHGISQATNLKTEWHKLTKKVLVFYLVGIEFSRGWMLWRQRSRRPSLLMLRGIGMVVVVAATSRMLLMRPVASLVRMMLLLLLLLLVWGMMPSGTVVVMSWIAAAM